MAIYSLNVSVISRGKGYSSTAAAAYRARTVVLDERTGRLHDYSRKADDLLFAGIYVPTDAPPWARDRQQLWNMVEHGEKRKDSQLARDFKIALPSELTPEQNRCLVQDWVRENVTRKNYVADVAIHAPSEHGDARNVHCHIMVTMRTLGTEGFAAAKDRTMNSKAQLQTWRESWEKLANRHLERHDHAARIDRRSLKAQGIDREPAIHMGKEATAAERRGKTTERGERQRAIKTRNRKAEELLKEIADLQQEQGIAAQFKENVMGWGDRLMHAFESIAAAPFGFVFGHDNSPEQYYRDPDKQTPEIHIHTNEVQVHEAAAAATPVQEAAPAQELALSPAQQAEEAFYAMQEAYHAQVVEQGANANVWAGREQDLASVGRDPVAHYQQEHVQAAAEPAPQQTWEQEEDYEMGR